MLRLLILSFSILLFSLFSRCSKISDEQLPLLLPRLQAGKEILLIGDSLTVRSGGFGLHEALGGVQLTIKATQGHTYAEWLQRSAELQTASFDTVLFVLGTNDGYEYSSGDFRTVVTEAHSKLAAQSSAAIYHTLPFRSFDKGLQVKIQANNQWLSGFCMQEVRAKCIDIDTPFQAAIEAGNPAGLYGIDPIHPEPAGYSYMGEIFIRELMQ